jgi:GMP synthase (glutamine-hydrolysing)
MSPDPNLKSICVVEQVAHAGPGRLAEVLGQTGAPWHLVKAGAGEPLPEAERLKGLILLGGPMSANDPLPFLQAEMALIEKALIHAVPILGICLGAQVLAKTLGAEVRRNPTPEIGWLPISPLPAAPADPLLRHVHAGSLVPQWHSETFDLPRGAVHLAASEACLHQAFRYGDRVHGVQFHPEVTAEIFNNWLAMDAGCGDACEVSKPPLVLPDTDAACAPLHGLLAAWVNRTLTLLA